MPVSGSTFLVRAWYSWFLRNISRTQDYSQYIWECKGKSEDKSKTSNAYSTVLVSKYLLNSQPWRLCFLSKGVYFPWAMKNEEQLISFRCAQFFIILHVSVQNAMFILAVNSYKRLFHFTKTWGLEDFWPSECPFDSRRQHYLYWAIVPLNKNGARWFLLMAFQIKFP